MQGGGGRLVVPRTPWKKHGLTVIDGRVVQLGGRPQFADIVFSRRCLIPGIVHGQNKGGSPECIVLPHVVDEGCDDRHDGGGAIVDLLVMGCREVCEWHHLGDGRSEHDCPESGAGIVAGI